MSAYDDPNAPYKQLYRQGLQNQRTRMASAMRALVSKRSDEVISKVVLGASVNAKELVRAVSTATEEIQTFFDQVTEAFEDMKEAAKQYVTYGDPGYTGMYDRDVKPIDFGRFLELFQDDDYRLVRLTRLTTKDGEEIRVSTVWTGMDYSGLTGAPPLIYESMVLGGKGNERADRYTTANQAQEGHAKLVEWVRQMEDIP